MYAISQYIIVT